MTYLIAGNWKMHGSSHSWQQLAEHICAGAGDVPDKAQLLVCPPFPGLSIRSTLTNQVALGGQDVSPYAEGAYTGDISAQMLKDAGCAYVIVGHSERREYHQEDDELVARKAVVAQSVELIPIVCIGETNRENAEAALSFLENQLESSIAGVHANRPEDLVIAYEPVWAIGTGNTATPEDIHQIHKGLREKLVSLFGNVGAEIKILYGGSVKPENAADILAVEDVNGALIGGASLKAESFLGIAKALA